MQAAAAVSSGARESAERVGGRDREVGGEPALGIGAVEHVARERRETGSARRERRHFGIAIERVGHDELAGLEPGEFGRRGQGGRTR